MIVQINAFKRYGSYESIIYAENWEQNTFHLSISKATKQFWKNRCEASKKIKSYYSKHFYLWRSFLHGQGIAMSEVTGLHDSENNDDFKFGLVVLYHDQWFGELCFSMPEALLGEINPSTACSSTNTSGLSSRRQSCEYPQEVPQMLEMNSSLPVSSWSTSVNPPQTNPGKHKYLLLSLLSESFIKSYH